MNLGVHPLIYFLRRLINYYPFDMLQTKVFYLFILAAAAIAPTATLPLPTETVPNDQLEEHQEFMKHFYLRYPGQEDFLEAFLYGRGGTSQ